MKNYFLNIIYYFVKMPSKCKLEGCDKRPYYNTPGETSGLYCKDHKVDGMIDVKNKICV